MRYSIKNALPAIITVFLLSLFASFGFEVGLSYANTTFLDLSSNHPHFEAAEYLRKEEILHGYPDGTFRPDRLINRAEFVKIIVNSIVDESEVFTCIENQNQKLFPDVRRNLWYEPFLCVAKEKGLIKGYPDGEFKGEKAVNFAEASKIIINGMKAKEGYEDFKLVEEGIGEKWFNPFVLKLEEKRAIPLHIKSFNHQPTRGEMSEIYYRLLSKKTDLESNTFANLASSCSPAILGASTDPLVSEFGKLPIQMGILDCQNKTEDYRLNNLINRAEAAKILFTLKLFSLMPDLTNQEREAIKDKNYINRVSSNYNPANHPYQDGQYPDVTKEAWYADYLASLSKWGVINGDEATGAFRPADQLNHAEAIKMLMGSYLTGGDHQQGSPVIQEWKDGTTWNTLDQEDRDYFVAAHQEDLNQISPAFKLSGDVESEKAEVIAKARNWYTPYLAEAQKANIGGIQSTYFNDKSVSKNIGDPIKRGDFILWAMRIFSNPSKDRLIFKTSDGFEVGKDNISVENDGFKISLGYLMHAFGFRYVVPQAELNHFIQNDENYKNKPDHFFSEEMEGGRIANENELFDILQRYKIRGGKGEELNEVNIFNAIQGEHGNCAGFNMITPSVFNGYEKVGHYGDYQYNESLNKGAKLKEGDRQDLYDLKSSDYVWKDLITEGGKKKQLVRLKDSIGYWWERQLSTSPTLEEKENSQKVGLGTIKPSEFVKKHVDYFKAHPEYIDEKGRFKYLPWRVSIEGSDDLKIGRRNSSGELNSVELSYKTNFSIKGNVWKISGGKIMGIENAKGTITSLGKLSSSTKDDIIITLKNEPTLLWEFEAPSSLKEGDEITIEGEKLLGSLRIKGDVNKSFHTSNDRYQLTCKQCSLSGTISTSKDSSLKINNITTNKNIIIHKTSPSIEFDLPSSHLNQYTELNNWGHTLNQYSMRKIGDHKYRFGVYDSNYPTHNDYQSYIEIDTLNETWENYLDLNKDGKRLPARSEDRFMTRKNLILEDNSFIGHSTYRLPNYYLKK